MKRNSTLLKNCWPTEDPYSMGWQKMLDWRIKFFDGRRDNSYKLSMLYYKWFTQKSIIIR